MNGEAANLADIESIAEEIRRRVAMTVPTGFVDAAQFQRAFQLIAGVRNGELLIGFLPPEPPTLRGLAGNRMIRIVRRMLLWFFPQVHRYQRSVADALEEVLRSHSLLQAQYAALSARFSALEARASELQ